MHTTKDELQATVELLLTQNENLTSQVSTLKADKEFLEAEKQVQIDGKNDDRPENNYRPDLPPPTSIDTASSSSSRRESNDSDATKEYVLAESTKYTSTGADSYDSIVAAFENSQVKVCELERLVSEIQRENQELKSLPKGTVEAACQTEVAEVDMVETACQTSSRTNESATSPIRFETSGDTATAADTADNQETDCSFGGGGNDVLLDIVAHDKSIANDTASPPKKLDFSSYDVVEEDKDEPDPQANVRDKAISNESKKPVDTKATSDDGTTPSDEKENETSATTTKKPSPSSSKQKSKRKPLSPLPQNQRPRRQTAGHINRYDPTKSELTTPSLPADSLELRAQLLDNRIAFGLPGYIFEKCFKQGGKFIGIVTEILPNGKRRCNYPLDPSPLGTEDLTLDDLPKPKQKAATQVTAKDKRRSRRKTQLTNRFSPTKKEDVKTNSFLYVGQPVFVNVGKANHPAIVAYVPSGDKMAKVKWTSNNTIQDVEVGNITPMEVYTSTKRERRRARKFCE